MPDTNDTLFAAASEETTATGAQTEGGLSTTEAPAASTETTARKLAGKFDDASALEAAYIALQKKLGQRSGDTVKDMGFVPEEVPATKTEAVAMAQEVGGDAYAQWLDKRSKEVGWSVATAELLQFMTKEAAKKTVAETLTPVNEKLTRMGEDRNTEMIEAATQQVTAQYPDFEAHAKEIGAYLAANPDVKRIIMGAPDKATKAKYLRMAYREVKDLQGEVATAAAKSAGAREATTQTAMKAATVTAGSGAGKTGAAPKDAGDKWLEEMQSLEKHRELF